MTEAMRRKVREVSGEIPVKFTTMDTLLAQTVASPRYSGILLGILAGLAVCLAHPGRRRNAAGRLGAGGLAGAW